MCVQWFNFHYGDLRRGRGYAIRKLFKWYAVLWLPIDGGWQFPFRKMDSMNVQKKILHQFQQTFYSVSVFIWIFLHHAWKWVYGWCVSSPAASAHGDEARKMRIVCAQLFITHSAFVSIGSGPSTHGKPSDMCAVSHPHPCLRMDECVVTKTTRAQYKLIGYLMLTEKGGSN